MLRKRLNALGLRDIQLMVIDVRETSIRGQSLCLLQLGIISDVFEGCFTTSLISSCEIDQERPAIGWRARILQCQLADYSSLISRSCRMGVPMLVPMAKPTPLFAPVTTAIFSYEAIALDVRSCRSESNPMLQ